MMAEDKQRKDGLPGKGQEKDTDQAKPTVSETWAEETIADLDEFIESQGIYIRQ